jgi:NitT/TauT family transport system ATP-binding protein
MSELIDVSGVEVEYAAKKVLSGINVSIRQGELVTVCGKTGCGKSTMLRLILGAEKPTRGRVLIDGREHGRPDRDRGYVPQKYSLFPDRTVLDNITFGPTMERFWLFGKRKKDLREEALKYLRMTGLHESDAHKYPDQLSGGMQQRVAIAQALIMRPRILLMDEAFSALDPATRADMQKLIRDLWARAGTTILFVTHNIAEAIYLGSRVLVLGKEQPEQGSRVLLDIEVAESKHERLTKLIENAVMCNPREMEVPA